jgi:hypothetical protein
MATQEKNPYQSPENVEFSDAERQNGIPWARPFVSAHAIAVWTILFLSATVVLQIVGAGISFSTLYFIRENIRAGSAVNIFVSGHTLLYMMLGFLLLMVFNSIATLAAFLLWVHRSYANLPSLGSTQPRFSPGLAIGMFLVPVLNFFQPWRIVHELWRESDPAGLDANTSQQHNATQHQNATQRHSVTPRHSASAAIIDAWWAALLITAAFNLGGRFFQSAGITLGEWRVIISAVVCSIAAICAILIVRRIDIWQQRRHDLLAKYANK